MKRQQPITSIPIATLLLNWDLWARVKHCAAVRFDYAAYQVTIPCRNPNSTADFQTISP
jgi:hypothetical protein